MRNGGSFENDCQCFQSFLLKTMGHHLRLSKHCSENYERVKGIHPMEKVT